MWTPCDMHVNGMWHGDMHVNDMSTACEHHVTCMSMTCQRHVNTIWDMHVNGMVCTVKKKEISIEIQIFMVLKKYTKISLSLKSLKFCPTKILLYMVYEVCYAVWVLCASLFSLRWWTHSSMPTATRMSSVSNRRSDSTPTPMTSSLSSDSADSAVLDCVETVWPSTELWVVVGGEPSVPSRSPSAMGSSLGWGGTDTTQQWTSSKGGVL